MKLADIDALWRDMNDLQELVHGGCDFNDAMCMVREAPTVEISIARRGVPLEEFLFSDDEIARAARPNDVQDLSRMLAITPAVGESEDPETEHDFSNAMMYIIDACKKYEWCYNCPCTSRCPYFAHLSDTPPKKWEEIFVMRMKAEVEQLKHKEEHIDG